MRFRKPQRLWLLPKPASRRAAGLAAGLLCAVACYPQNRGEADVAVQGFYLGGSSQNLLDTSGVSVRFRDLVQGLGFLSGSMEGYGTQNRLQMGENFLELRGVPWRGQRWTFTGGDFRALTALVPSPFFNIFTPDITARGIQVQAGHEGQQIAFFAGEETLPAGPRVPYRIRGPQKVIGASVLRKLGNLQIGARLLQFSSSAAAIAENPYLFPSGRALTMARTMSAQSLYAPWPRFKVYAEVSRPLAGGQQTLTSSLAGMAWDGSKFTVRANYASQGALYFPLAGFFAGDRRGPFGEARYRPWKRLELSGSASQYQNNLERDPNVTSLRSTNTSAGLTVTLPGKLAATSQISTVRFSSITPDGQTALSHNRQNSTTLSRNLGNHSVHVNWRDLRLDAAGAQRQRAAEAEDMYHFKRFFVGGAVRVQQTSGIEQRNSVFFRGTAQGSVGRLNFYSNVEMGNDLVNRTVFATNTYSTSVVGAAVRLIRGWNLQGEIFRNLLNMQLNPSDIFLLQGQGAPVAATAIASSQWSVYFRLTKQIKWGGGLRGETPDQYIARTAPLVGSVDGLVWVQTMTGATPAAGVPVTLDQNRTVVTAIDGKYHFDEVAEGEHDVALSQDLPADYDPGTQGRVRLAVHARRATRADFDVLPLGSVEGRVTGPEGLALDGILIRLLPGDRYTTTVGGGQFSFYNVREGNFEVVLQADTLPENARAESPSRVPLEVRAGSPLPSVQFSVTVENKQKPIRKVLELK